MLNLNQSNYEFAKHFILPLASKQELKRNVIPKINVEKGNKICKRK